jgi:hypothetical protein
MMDRTKRCVAILALLLSSTTVFAGQSSPYAVIDPRPSAQGTPGIVVTGSLTEDSLIRVSYQGSPPGVPGGAPPFLAGVKCNGWGAPLNMTWNEETQCWEVYWRIPPGTLGQQIVFTIMFPNGTVLTHSITVQ